MSATDPVSSVAEAAFQDEYGGGPGRPVCVVMAALDEEGSIEGVIRALPGEVHGLATECVVVDDGSSDTTADTARRAGAMVCRLESHQGQGAALRTGYRLASQRGAQLIATIDADGQFDPGELERLVTPIVEERADMVQGSRRLGRSETTDRVRASGVVAFGWLISLLTGARITDPANGFRAFRPEVPERVPLRQPQYQTSELLIGAIALGYRVVEVPVTVRARASGRSKKGANLLYGLRFGRVVVTTWWSLRGERARARPDR